MVHTIRVWYVPYAYGIKYAYGIQNTDTNEFNDIINEEATTPTQVDNPCHSSHVFLPTASVNHAAAIDTHKHHYFTSDYI